MIHTFCPNCFEDIGPDAEICKSCSISVKEWMAQKSYTERLIHALDHPISEVRMGAIISLGKLKEVKAAIPLAKCAFTHPIDVIQGLEITRALKQMDFEREVEQALKMLSTHPARAIRRAVYSIQQLQKSG
jgi:HEAT repeat protein